MIPQSQNLPKEAPVESAMKTISQLVIESRIDEATYTTLWNALEMYRAQGDDQDGPVR